MAHDVLLGFLKLDLIDVSGNDERFDKLGQTATDVAALIKKSPAKTISFSLAALDPNISTTDPSIVETLAVLEKKWPTYSNAFDGVPVNVARAILLDALTDAAKEDDNVAVAFACLVRNLMPFIKAGNEQPIWTSSVSQVEKLVDERAAEEWTTPSSVATENFTFSPSTTEIKGKLTHKTTNRETLRDKIKAAFVPQQHGGHNPYFIQNNHVAWAQTAAASLAEAIGETTDAVVASVEFKGGDITGAFKTFADAATKYVDAAIQSIAIAAGGLDRRTSLLWWREALYSPSAHVSYRDLPLPVSAALMALDLSNQIPIFSPASVASFLREAVQAISQGRDEAYALKALLEHARATSELSALREAATTLAPQLQGRGTLLAVIGQSETELPAETKFVELVGVGYDTSLRATDWAKWLFSELQALKAVQKRKLRKS